MVVHNIFEQTPNSHLAGNGCMKCSGKYKSDTEDFIRKAVLKHGDLYDYSKVDYTTALVPVVITCKVTGHGEFKQTPNNHLNGQGCSKCGYNMTIFSTEQFIAKAREVHQNTYDYSDSIYSKMAEKLTIICKVHRAFEQTPSNHITHKQGCQQCAQNYLSNTLEFVEKAKKVHGEKYSYKNVNYVNNHTKVRITCKLHGDFDQTPQNHLSGYECVLCANIARGEKQRSTLQDFIEKSTTVHGNKYCYKKVEYINAKTEVTITCAIHGDFQQVPDVHLRGCGCYKCGHNMTIFTTEDFIKKAVEIHSNEYDYSLVDYKTMNYKVQIICKKHGMFEKNPTDHLSGGGCSKCYSNYSRTQIKWLDLIAALGNVNIQHASNDGEYVIPETLFRADGYCQETNTIYEFHGDYWHGNPKRFNKDDINKTVKKTFGELYDRTIVKENRIKELGYNLVVMWEYDWSRLNRCVRKVQLKYRKNHKI